MSRLLYRIRMFASRYQRGCTAILAWFFTLSFLLGSSHAQNASAGTIAQMVTDLNITTNPALSSSPREFLTIGPITYFIAEDSTNGRELWKTDGTPSGTTLLIDLTPGWGGSFDSNDTGETFGLTNAQGTLFFERDGSLWKSDGTAAGTVLIKQISTTTKLETLTALGGLVFFTMHEAGISSYGLWRSDGTAAGTFRLRTLTLPTTSPQLAAAHGRLFFSDTNQLWISDGTQTGTMLLKNVIPSRFQSVNDLFFFQAGGQWVSDGTETGTRQISETVVFDGLTDVNGTLFFAANGFLWKTDGTSAGTQKVSEQVLNPNGLRNVNGTLFFVAFGNLSTDYAVWTSDGTSAGTRRVKALRPQWDGNYLYNYTSVNGTYYFTADQQSTVHYPYVYDLWASDGTEAGTRVIAGGWVSNAILTSANGMLLLAATTSTNGSELWRSDGTSAGTSLLKDINVGRDGTNLLPVASIGDRYFFINSTDRELWKSDGTAAGTVRLTDMYPGITLVPPDYLVSAGATLFFILRNNANSFELWKSDGTPGGTGRLKSLGALNSSTYSFQLTAVGSTLYLTVADSNGLELWTSDGSAAGTHLLKDINPGPSDANPTELTAVNGTLYFAASDGSHGVELWKSDGTPAGTVQVKDITVGSDDSSLRLKNVDGRLFFVLRDASGDQRLWKSDGNDASTMLVKDLSPGIDQISSMVSAGPNLFFIQIQDGYTAVALWRSDGTEAGTTIVKPVAVEHMIGVNDTLFFITRDPISGMQLWKSDGTSTGTLQVTTLTLGPTTTLGTDLVALPALGGVVFPAYNPATGMELWQSDGTAEGTVMTQDITPGPGSSYPVGITTTGSRLFFQADDSLHGRELWTAALSDLDFSVPTAIGSSVTTGMNGVASGILSGNDADSDPLTFSVAANGNKGLVTITDPATGAFTYTARPGTAGTDTFTFRTSDGLHISLAATMTVTIANSAPVANDLTIISAADTPVSGKLSATDAQGNPLTYHIVSNGTYGQATITNPATGAFVYTPSSNAIGSDRFTFQASDGVLLSNLATVMVTTKRTTYLPVLRR